MSYVMVAPEIMTTAATDLATIGSDLSAAHSAAAPATLDLTPAAADEVSLGVAHLFTRYAQDYHGLAGRAAVSHEQFVQNLKVSAVSYSSIEEIIAAYLHRLNANVIHFVKALPAEELYGVTWALFRVLFGKNVVNDPVTQGFLGALATAPPRQAIPLLLTFPVSELVLFYLYLLAQL